MSTQARTAMFPPATERSRAALGRPVATVLGVIALALAYYAAAKLAQSLRYTASVSAVWLPVGLGIAALYLFGLRLWPAIFLGELLVNTELLLENTPLPVGSIAGQQLGNMAEVVVGAILLRRFLGRRSRVDRVTDVIGLLAALAAATAVSATVGTLSMLAGDVIDAGDIPSFWRTWWLGDTAGGLIMVPLILVWGAAPLAALRRLASLEGVLLVATVSTLSVLAVSTGEPLTYIVFPALIWAAFRFGPTGATLAVALLAFVTIAITADDLGFFSKQAIDDRTLGTQLYVVVAAVTTLFVSAVVAERARAAQLLTTSKQRERDRAIEERHRIARDLHDSVSQALFSALLETRAAQRALGLYGSTPLAHSLATIAELIRSAQSEMRALIFEAGRNSVDGGLTHALIDLAREVGEREHLPVEVHSPSGALQLTPRVETQLFAIAREALSNVVKHARASTAWIDVEVDERGISVVIGDDGCGFASGIEPAGHFGLASMRSRATEIGGTLSIVAAPGSGTIVHVTAPATAEANGR